MSFTIKDGAGNSQLAEIAGNAATYRAAVGAVAPGATPADFLIITGSASKTVRVKSIHLSGQATASGQMAFTLIRRSSAASGGTPNAVTIAKHDTTDSAATASVTYYTAANTPGTGAGVLYAGRHNFAISSAIQTPTVVDFATRGDKAIVLRGTGDSLAVSYGGGALIGGGVIDFAVEWEEDNS